MWHAVYDGAGQSSRHGGSRDSRKAVAVNERRDYPRLEREFITSQISLRELCRRHNITSHSVVVDQAKKHKWAAKREQYQARESDAFMSRHAARQADRQAEIHDEFLDTNEQALDKLMADLKATKLVRQPDGSIVEMPAWFMTPRDLCLLTDRLMVLFEKPSVISQHQGLSVTSELSADALREFIGATREAAAPPASRCREDGGTTEHRPDAASSRGGAIGLLHWMHLVVEERLDQLEGPLLLEDLRGTMPGRQLCVHVLDTGGSERVGEVARLLDGHDGVPVAMQDEHGDGVLIDVMDG